MRKARTGKLKLLCVVCHPADAIDGAGGTLCQHAARGDQVTVVVCTHGVDTHDLRRNDRVRFGGRGRVTDPVTARDRKEAEVVAGMKLLGVTDVRFLRFADELLTVSPKLIEALAAVMAEVQPHLMITHNPTENAGLADIGHADSAQAALKAQYLANTQRFLRRPPGRKFPAQIFFLTMNGQTTRLTAEGSRFGNVLIDISDVIERKVRALDCLASQYYPGLVARKVLEDVNGQMGLHWRLSYAESFQTYFPESYRYLPANPYLLEFAATSARERARRLRLIVPFIKPPTARTR
ncbi:MAG: PIG-L family deacetylase [Verrucomicrobiae bacterium]|nr:PIG-L family deacetylase [Verrucomicrobiae bacterium]